MDPNDPHANEWYAILLAGGATAVAALWKAVFSFRRDLRNDKDAGARGSVVDELRREVERLSRTVQELSEKLDAESGKRRAVETENHDLRLRIGHLEQALKGAMT